MLNALVAQFKLLKGLQIPSTHRLRRGLPGLVAPTLNPQRQLQAREPLSPPVFLHIYAFHRHMEFHFPLAPAKQKFPKCNMVATAQTYLNRLLLRPINPDKRSGLRIPRLLARS